MCCVVGLTFAAGLLRTSNWGSLIRVIVTPICRRLLLESCWQGCSNRISLSWLTILVGGSGLVQSEVKRSMTAVGAVVTGRLLLRSRILIER